MAYTTYKGGSIALWTLDLQLTTFWWAPQAPKNEQKGAAGAEKTENGAPQAPKSVGIVGVRRRRRRKKLFFDAQKIGNFRDKNWSVQLTRGGVYSPLPENCTTYKGGDL